MSLFKRCVAAWLPAAIALVSAGAAHAEPARLVVASFGGQLDAVYKEVFKPFEAANDVVIQWVPGTAPGNVAKLAATRNAPEYDLILFDNINQRVASKDGLLAELRDDLIPQAAQLVPGARASGNDGVGIGAFVTGLYYRSDVYAQKGWQAPRHWADLGAHPELCGNLGLERATQVHTLNAVLMLASANPANIDEGIDRFAKLAECARVLEPAAAKHEEKILQGDYQLGVYSSIRSLPLVRRVPGLAFVVPEEGAVRSFTMVSPVKGAPNAELAQRFIDWFLTPPVQDVLVRELFYSPVNTQVAVPADLVALGLPDRAVFDALPTIDDDTVVDNRREWTRRLERALTR